jgi:hypothetical protein
MQFTFFTRSFLSFVNCSVKQPSGPDKIRGDVEGKLVCKHKWRVLEPGLSGRKHLRNLDASEYVVTAVPSFLSTRVLVPLLRC